MGEMASVHTPRTCYLILVHFFCSNNPRRHPQQYKWHNPRDEDKTSGMYVLALAAVCYTSSRPYVGMHTVTKVGYTGNRTAVELHEADEGRQRALGASNFDQTNSNFNYSTAEYRATRGNTAYREPGTRNHTKPLHHLRSRPGQETAKPRLVQAAGEREASPGNNCFSLRLVVLSKHQLVL